MPVIPLDESVELNVLLRLARVFEAAVFLAVPPFAGAFFAGALGVAVFLAATFFAGALAVAVFLAATFFPGAFFAGVFFAAVAFLAATFFAGVFFAGAFEVVVVEAAVFVFLTDACLLERVLVVTGFFAPVGAAFFSAAGLALADVFFGAGCFDALAAD